MKKIALFLVAIPLILTSCSKEPFADFMVSDAHVGVGEAIYLTNHSIDAVSFEWDFGDGFISNSYNAMHYYDIVGDYTIRLKAFNEKGMVDISELRVNIGASIEITVEEFYEPFYLVPDIKVILYASVYDWEHPETSPIVAEKYTNNNGVVRFDHLEAKRYYVDIYGPNHDNYKLAEEDVFHIETPQLIQGSLIDWTALVDYYEDGKKSSLDRFQTKAKRKLEAEGQVPRSAADRK